MGSNLMARCAIALGDIYTIKGEISIFIDRLNQAAQAMTANPVIHERTKHTDLGRLSIRIALISS
jgi:hypothetical protein